MKARKNELRYALVGYGRMGREIEAEAGRRGHALVRIVDPAADGELARPALGPGVLDGVQVAFEFTRPDTAEANVLALARAGVDVICGTTGWTPAAPTRRELEGLPAGVLVAPNFSVGMNLFYGLVRDAARRLGASGLYQPFVLEWHHRGKLDAPSGTAGKLAALVAEADPRHGAVCAGNPDAPLAPEAVHVASLRAGHEPGTHTVGFDGEYEGIRLTHAARGRRAFALGAVLAAEWLAGRGGWHTFEQVLDDLLAERRSGS